MSPPPTGRIVRTPHGRDLVIERTFRAPIDDVWESVTAPDSTARWFGRWEGDAGPGKMIRVQMGFEQGAPWISMRVDACAAPTHLALTGTDDFGDWKLELALAEHAGVTTLTFTQHIADPKIVGEVGPGWEYYLDMLVAARAGEPLPAFDAYYPAQRDHYVAQNAALDV